MKPPPECPRRRRELRCGQSPGKAGGGASPGVGSCPWGRHCHRREPPRPSTRHAFPGEATPLPRRSYSLLRRSPLSCHRGPHWEAQDMFRNCPLSIYAAVCPFVHPSTTPLPILTIHPIIHLPIHIATHPPTQPSTHPPSHRCLHPPIHQPAHPHPPSIHPATMPTSTHNPVFPLAHLPPKPLGCLAPRSGQRCWEPQTGSCLLGRAKERLGDPCPPPACSSFRRKGGGRRLSRQTLCWAPAGSLLTPTHCCEDQASGPWPPELLP